MAQLTRNFLTSGPIASDFGNISASDAYAVIFEQIGQAIVDASNKNAENSQKTIDELKALRSHLKEEARKHADTRIGQLPPDIAREFLEASRSIKQILGSRAPGSAAATVYSNQARTQSVKSGGTLGTAVLVQAIQDNSAAIKDTNYAIKDLPDLIQKTHDLTTGTFKVIHNFLNPNHPHSLMNALSKLFKGGTSETSLLSKVGSFFSYLGSMLLGRIAGPILRMVFAFMRGSIATLGSFALSYMIKKAAEKLRDYLGYTPTGGWGKVLELGELPKGWGIPESLGGGDDSLFSLKLDPKVWGWLFPYLRDKDNKNKSGGSTSTRGFLNPEGGVVPGGQIDPVSFNIETRGIKLLEGGFNEGFNTGISNKGNIVLELMKKQTELLAEILRTLLGRSGGQGGFIRALQAGGTAAPGERVVVGEDGPERIQIGGKSGTVLGPHVLQAGDSPVQVSPQRAVAGSSPLQATPQDAPRTRSLTVGSTAVSSLFKPLNPNPIDKTFEPTTPTIYYTGPEYTGGKKTKSVTYTDPQTGQTYTDRTPPIGPPSSRLPSETPGIAFGYHNFPKHGRETLGGYYLVTPKGGVSAGESFILAHSDVGPGAKGGEHKIDYNAPAAQMVFGSMKESALQGGAYLRYIGANLPEGVTVGKQPVEGITEKYGLSPAHSQFIQEQEERVVSGYSRGAAPQSATRPKQLEQVKASPAQQNARLRVDNAGGATTSDMHRRVSNLQDKAREDRKQKPEKTQLPSHPEGHHRRGRTSPNRVAFTDVGPVAVSAGSGFS